MKTTDRAEVMAAIGLKPLMVWREKGPPIYKEEDFARYVEPSYRSSSIAESDEVYRMFEMVLMHKVSGMRARVTTSESYSGDTCDYKVIDLFILADDGRAADVLGVDMAKKLVFTAEGATPFAKVNKAVVGA